MLLPPGVRDLPRGLEGELRRDHFRCAAARCALRYRLTGATQLTLSQGWSCCKPRVLEFDEFLSASLEAATDADVAEMPGCTRNRHLFVGGVKPESAEVCQATTDLADAAGRVDRLPR